MPFKLDNVIRPTMPEETRPRCFDAVFGLFWNEVFIVLPQQQVAISSLVFF